MSTDSCLMEFDSLLRESYRVAIENKFGFKHDYVGEDQVNPRRCHPIKILPSVVGFVKTIPPDALSSFEDISISKKTEACKFESVMLGPTRFANHSCRPKYRYSVKEN